MTTTTGHGPKRNTLMILTAAAFLAAALFASSAPAEAKDKGHKNQNHGRKARSAQVVHYTVPQVLTPEHRGWSKPYYAGRAYYAPHRHYHARYSYPVWYGGAVSYRPYAYCGDHLFVTGAVTLPQLAIGFNFGSPGGLAIGGYYQGGPYPGGYYPAPPPAPVAYYRWDDRYRQNHDCGHDHGHHDHDDHDDWDD